MKKCLFFINTSIFNWKSLDVKCVKNPFHEIYRRYYEHFKDSVNNAEFIKRTRSSDNNNSLFYSGLERQCKEVCNRYWELLSSEVEKYTKMYFTHNFVKIKMNDIDNGKTKRLLGILISLIPKSNLCKNETIDILFPIEYKDWH